MLPLVSQEAETHEPDACPQDWGVAGEKRGRGNLAQEGFGWGLAGWPLPPSPPESTPLEKLGCPLLEPRAVGHVLCFDQLKLDLKMQLLCCTGHT